MITSSQPESRVVHHLARFVTREAIALLLNLKPQEIYRIDCWRYVIHVVGKGISTFVRTVPSLLEMYRWGELVGVIKSVLPEATVEWLRSIYIQEKHAMENFSTHPA